jgi:hypothetical protein
MPAPWTEIPAAPGRAYQFVVRQPSWVARIALTAAILMLMAVLILLIGPAVVIGAVVFLALAGVARAKAWLTGLRSPNGALDGRKNVRVIVRE